MQQLMPHVQADYGNCTCYGHGSAQPSCGVGTVGATFGEHRERSVGTHESRKPAACDEGYHACCGHQQREPAFVARGHVDAGRV
jgi:hypothetical protein